MTTQNSIALVCGVSILSVLAVGSWSANSKVQTESGVEARSKLGLNNPGDQDEFPPGFTALDYDRLHQPAVAMKQAWLRQEYAKLRASGMEAGQAGFHIIMPSENYQLLNPFLFTNVERGTRFDFWMALPAQSEIPYLVCPLGSGDRGPLVTLTRPFEGDLLSMARVVPDPAGQGHAAEISFGAEGLDRLSLLLGPFNATEQYVDWFGEIRQAGAARSQMKVVVVMDNVAYLPIMVEPIVALQQVDVPLLAATGLSYESAAKMVSRLGF